MGWQETKEFLSKVVAWPGDNPGFVNLHYSMPRQDGGKDIVTGKPFRDIDQFLGFASWALRSGNIKEQWYCTSQQSTAGETQTGKPKAIRLHQNATLLKAIWVDIDVKDDPKHYGSMEDAWSAFTEFRKKAALPTPSAVVKSGGGLHIYWLSDRPLTTEEWAPYAHGLKTLLLKHGVKCDAGLTTDNVRLLRVPNTLNHKYDPPRPVELLPIPLAEYDFAEDLAFLAEVTPVPTIPPVPGLPASFVGKKPLITGTDKLSDGIVQEDKPLPFEPIVKGCAFIRDALKAGGAEYSQPMWNLTTLAATFMENGYDLAHRMGRGHPAYTRADTDQLWTRKLRERADRGLGWPSCAAIQSSGCGSCATCPHFAAGKSPLNLATGASAARVSKRDAAGGDLPKGYVRDKEGFICKLEEKKTKEGEVITLQHRLFLSKIDAFWAEKNATNDIIHFRTSYDKGNFITGFITHVDMVSGQIATALAKSTARVKVCPEGKKYVEGFFVSLLAHLHEQMQAQQTQPFGWVESDNKVIGFVYGGRMFKTDGTDVAAGAGDPRLANWYQPTGELNKWFDAARTVTSLKKPELDALIVSSFASPLIKLTGQKGVTLAAWGESGTGKTSAMEVGLSVWSTLEKTKEGKASTEKALYNKMGATRHLPVYWDEITDDRSIARAVEVSFSQTGGTEGSRLNQAIEQRDRGTWQCMLITSANISLVDEVVKRHHTHRGGINRVFEYEVPKNDKSRLISPTDADRIFGALSSNYGMMGLQYARFLATNHDKIVNELVELRKKIEIELHATQEERFWTCAVATLILGAKYANMLGLDVDEPALERFLFSTLLANRDRSHTEAMVGGGRENTEALLNEYLKARAALQTIWTDGLKVAAGKQKPVTLLHAPERSSNVREGIQVRWDVATRSLSISRKDFGNWLEERNISPTPIIKGLIRNYGMEWPYPKRVLASGTSFKALPEALIFIKVVPNTSLWDVLTTYSPVDDREAAE